MLFGTRKIIDRGTPAGGGSVMYTVPKGKIFFLNSCTIIVSKRTYAAPEIETYAYLYVNDTSSVFCATACFFDEQSNSIALSFPIPLRMVESESIIALINDSGDSSHSTITGYEIDASLIPTFL